MQHLRLFEDRHEDQEAADDEEDDGKNNVHFDRPLEIWLFPSGGLQLCLANSNVKMKKAINLVFVRRARLIEPPEIEKSTD